MAFDEDLANRVRSLVAHERGVTEKQMFGGLAFLVNGNMSVSANRQGGLLVRVEPDETDRLSSRAHVSHFVTRGRPMDGWLRVAADGVRTKRQLESWVTRSVAYRVNSRKEEVVTGVGAEGELPFDQLASREAKCQRFFIARDPDRQTVKRARAGSSRMRISRVVGGRTKAAIAALVIATGLATAQPASAANTPPRAAGGLIGTWVNETKTPGTVLKKLVIRSDGAGGITVDTFGICATPTLCEYGRVPTVVFGPAADSTVGRFFETNQVFATYSKVLLGRLVDTSAGQRITLQRFVVFTSGSRHNSALNYQFKRVSTSTAGTTKTGTATTAFPTGLQPAPSASLLGTWHNTNASTRGLAQLIVTHGSGNSLLVHAFGACTPTFCDIGTFTGVTYGRLATSTTGERFLASHDAGFKNELYTGQVLGDGTLKVTYYSEYTDSSGRSNFAISETFAH